MKRRFDYYLGVPEPSWLNRGDGVPKFVSAARLDRLVTREQRWPVRATPGWVIDSGAYIALTSKNQDTPWWSHPETYASKILSFATDSGCPPDFVAPQDWPCEPSVRRRTGLTVREHQQATLDNYLFLVEEWPWLPWIPVLQGWAADDYRVHERMYADAGVDLAGAHRVGVGSICRRGHLPQIVEVIEQFAGSGYQLHGFGIKATALPVIGHLLRSADSMAWSYRARKSGDRLPGCDHAGPDCRNCYRYAVRWRERVLSTMKEIAVPTTLVQPVAAPGSHEAYAALIAGGVLIDLAGRPLTFRHCEPCGQQQTSGMTCPAEVACPQCGVKAGSKRCKRPSGHDAATWHKARVDAAENDNVRRAATGDLGIPAPWPTRPGSLIWPSQLIAGDVFETVEPGRGPVTYKRLSSIHIWSVRVQVEEGGYLELQNDVKVRLVRHGSGKPMPAVDEPSRNPASTTTEEGTTMRKTASTPTFKLTAASYGTGTVPGPEVQPGEFFRCPIAACGRKARLKRDGTVGAHKMYGAQTCDVVNHPLPVEATVSVFGREDTTTTALSAPAAADEVSTVLADLEKDLAELLTGAAAAAETTDAADIPRALPPVYTAPVLGELPAGAVSVRVDQLEAHDVIVSRIPGDPGLFLYGKPSKVESPGDVEGDGRYLVSGTRDGERPGEKHTLRGSVQVPVVRGDRSSLGWRPGHFETWKQAQCKVSTAKYPDGLRVTKVTSTTIEAMSGKQRVAIGYGEITAMKEWDVVHTVAGHPSMTRAMENPAKYYGFDGGEHEFRPTFAGSLRCTVCCGSVRSQLHTGVLNADFEQFEQLRMELLRPGQTNIVIRDRTEELDRYVRGLPLVRQERDRDSGMTFSCPVQCGGGTWFGFSTLRGVQAAWFKHCAEKHDQVGPRWGNWQEAWRPTWDGVSWPTGRRTIGFRFPAKARRDSVERPARVKVVVPKDDPAWEELIARFRAEGRGMHLQPAGGGRHHAVMSIMFNEGTVVAHELRADLREAGIPGYDIEIIELAEVRVPLQECLAVVHDPSKVELCNGTVREPEGMFAHLDTAAVDELLSRTVQAESGPVKAVILHEGSGKAIVVGPFAEPHLARAWWDVDYNRMRRGLPKELLLLPYDGDLPVLADQAPAEELLDLEAFVADMTAAAVQLDLEAFVVDMAERRTLQSAGPLLDLEDFVDGMRAQAEVSQRLVSV